MPDALYIEMPSATPVKKRRLWLRLLPVWALLGCAVGVVWWVMAGRVASSWGMLDGMVFPVASDFAARVEAVAVREGDSVREGQIIARLDAREAARHLDAAGRDVAGLRASAAPPDMEETAARLRDVQEAERDMTRRLASARHEEEARKKRREDLVAEHVRAQLALRTLETQGGEHAVGQTRYAAARQAEARARAAMEQAAAEFEQASLARAAMDQELARVREETLRCKQLASRSRYAMPNYTREALTRAGIPRQQSPDGNLYAPRDGRILRGLAAQGQMVQAGEPVALLLPEGKGARNAYWVLAFFPQSEGAGLKAGQKCSITVDGEKGEFSGRVYDVLEPQPLPAAARAAATEEGGAAPALFVPARVLIDNTEERTLTPGVEARCVVSTRSILP
ncbi:HlyD family efflux transporter periplasmic adaptor subunit [uncultured Desulfovibrio sp.]|uniref:HlyD family secretion protein n=1 Tax=uncultured Desulfovibrio sp. TaxID=167968 RepID=UPI00262C95C4|nr:HlyD family efflux transporter periplasmic adaptor subunit [uncultured Desulfovibrio sp.]